MIIKGQSLRMLAKVTLVGMGCLLLACTASQSSDVGQSSTPQNLIDCPDQRPQMCTMQYDPVCAWHEDGRSVTKGSACSACGDHSVEGYLPGECPASE